MAKQLKKFCRITKYIEKTDPKLYEILEDLCVMGAFRVKRGHTGVSFIWPSDETIKKVSDLRYTDDIDKGCDIILAHIVQDYLPNAAAWNAKKSDIPNGLHKKLEVKAASGNKVVLIDGSELEVDAKFKTFSKGDENQAVWKVVKGSLDHGKHNKSANFEHARAAPGHHTKQRSQAQAAAVEGGAAACDAIDTYIANLAKSTTGKVDAPYCHLADLQDFARNYTEDPKAALCMKLVLSPLVVSSLAFAYSSQAPECVQKLVEAFKSACEAEDSPYGKTINGLHQYLSRMEEDMKVVSKIGGGAILKDINEALGKAITESSDKHKTALASIDLDASFTPFFVNLCLARECEYTVLKGLKGTMPSDRQHELDQMKSIIMDRSTLSVPDTKEGTQTMGILIASLLTHIQNFNKGKFSCYPIHHTKETFDELKKYATDHHVAGGMMSTLQGMSGGAFSALMASIGR